MSTSGSTIYILYNANASLLGKLNYVCRKITAPSDSSPCAACDLTHGGLHLDESAAWTKTKSRIHADVKQLHRDELTPDIREYIKANSIKYPVVLGKSPQPQSPLKVLLDSSTLSKISTDHSAFLSLLSNRAEEERIPLTIDNPQRVKDDIFRPAVQFIPQAVTPGHLTFGAFVAGLAACLCAASARPFLSSWAVYLWLLNRVLDCLDGAVARARDQTSDCGGFMDLLSDFIIYSLIPISVSYGLVQRGMVAEPATNLWLPVSLLEASFHLNNFVLFYLAAVSSQKGSEELTSVTMKPAPIEGFESGVIFTLMLAFPRTLQNLSWGMALGVGFGITTRVWQITDVFSVIERKAGPVKES
ncbi:hypothetical protein LTR96_004245 [Exophiala xenobiotica]|nr:hypothetical protein LTR96_004245 [Exophiala xenobiotica]KAK5339858.1 hypothetical protein LTR98_004660 [Exophiala xenobiotica]